MPALTMLGFGDGPGQPGPRSLVRIVRDLAAVLRGAQLVAFGLVAASALWQYRRRRATPARYLALAFAVLAVALALGRLSDVADDPVGGVLRLAAVVGVTSFPWLLAAFAWSFDGRLPAWLRAAWLGVALVALLFAVTGTGGADGGQRDGGDLVFLAGFLVVWLVPSVATAVRLLAAGGSTSRVVRARMRLLAWSLIVLSLALIVTIAAPPEGLDGARVVGSVLALLSAGMAHAGFSPPLPLRLWWRRQGAHHFQSMQQELIAAVTPDDAARAVAPILAGTIGAGTAVLDGSGRVLAIADLSAASAHEAWQREVAGEPPSAQTRVVRVGSAVLVVQMTNYSPFFGDYEQELVSAYAWQLRLALERSDLAARHLEARRAAERANHELETMLVGLSHDLRSPAVAIHGYSSLLRGTADEEERAQFIDGISASSDYLNGLVDALLELSRVGRTQTETEPVDLAAVARMVAKRIAVSHPSATVEVDDELPVVRLNPIRAEQLVDNLVSNAVKHGGRDGLMVRVTGRHTDEVFELQVADDGGGVRPEDRDRIFDLFQRGRDPGSPGTGVGLGMVRRIAELHGGEVHLADSETGACFVVSFPRAVLEPTAERAAEAS